MMKIEYSPDADAIYIELKDVKIANSDEITDDVIVDYDENGNIAGIEILAVSRNVDDIRQVIFNSFENVILKTAKVA
ncbi:MAG: DUF2283 domain-containing protein [Candidatus Poribacteria bacterium]